MRNANYKGYYGQSDNRYPTKNTLASARTRSANDVGLRLGTPQLGTLLEGMQKIANGIFTGLVLAGLLVASGLMIQSWPRLGIIGFTIAGLIAVYMILSILISDRKRGG